MITTLNQAELNNIEIHVNAANMCRDTARKFRKSEYKRGLRYWERAQRYHENIVRSIATFIIERDVEAEKIEHKVMLKALNKSER